MGRLHLVDVQQVKHRLQDGQPPTNHGLAVFLDPFEPQVVWFLGFEQAVLEPGEAFAGDETLWPPGSGQDIGHSTDRAGRAIAFVPVVAVEQDLGFIEHRLGRNFRRFEAGRCPNPVGKELHGPGHAAHAVRLQRAGFFTLTQNHLGRATSDVHHQATLIGLRQQV